MFSATWPKDVRKLAEEFLKGVLHDQVEVNSTIRGTMLKKEYD
jgi:superfamily II DNA/RNA helicase